MSTRALSSGEYFVTFIDDHYKKTWIYLMKTKDEFFDRFREFKALLENAIGKKITMFHSNNGGDSIDKGFTNFCAKEGINERMIATIIGVFHPSMFGPKP